MQKEQTIKTKIYNDNTEGSRELAKILVNNCNLILSKKNRCVISLPTGNSPINLYKSLIELYKKKQISFKNIVFFNLDEFYPISKKDPQSYSKYLNEKLFNHIDMPKKNINLFNGNIKEKGIKRHCIDFEKKIKELGGLDIQVLGIGKNGHIGFNEPGSLINSKTRKVKISNDSIKVIINEFNDKRRVPQEALTMGVQTILSANKIFLMAWGKNKSSIINKTIKSDVSKDIPATYLKTHKNVTFILDKESSSEIFWKNYKSRDFEKNLRIIMPVAMKLIPRIAAESKTWLYLK